MTSFTKPEVYNISHCHHRKTEPWPQVICAENSVKFGRVMFELCNRRDRQTYIHADHNTSHPSQGDVITVVFDALYCYSLLQLKHDISARRLQTAKSHLASSLKNSSQLLMLGAVLRPRSTTALRTVMAKKTSCTKRLIIYSSLFTIMVAKST